MHEQRVRRCSQHPVFCGGAGVTARLSRARCGGEDHGTQLSQGARCLGTIHHHVALLDLGKKKLSSARCGGIPTSCGAVMRGGVVQVVQLSWLEVWVQFWPRVSLAGP